MPQTEVIDYIDVQPREGALVHSAHSNEIKTVLANEDGLIPGRFCGHEATTDHRVGRHPEEDSEVTQTFHGVVILDATREPTLGADDVLYKEGTAAPVLERGVIWVRTETAVAYGDPAFARTTAPLGAFRNDDDTGDAVRVPGGARFVSAAAGGELAKLQINLPGAAIPEGGD